MTPISMADEDVFLFLTAPDRSVTARKCLSGFRKGDEGSRSMIDESNRAFLARLESVFQDASQPNWDGYNALPVSQTTLEMARFFLDLFPATLEKPDVSVHPDGELAFEWYYGPRRLLTVAVSEFGRLSYAAMFGNKEAQKHGTEYMLGKVPDEISSALRRLRFEVQPAV